MNLCRCTNCGSWFDLLRFPRCPVCGTDSIPMAMPRGAAGSPTYGEAEREAERDRSLSRWMLLLGVFLGLAGPLALIRADTSLTLPMFFMMFLMLAVVTVFGLSGNPKTDSIRYAAGQVARSALLTIAIAIAVACLAGGVALVLLFVACVA